MSEIDDIQFALNDCMKVCAQKDARIAQLEAEESRLTALCSMYFKDINQLVADNAKLREALNWIADACDVDGRCGCGKPNGIPAIRSHALRHIPAPPAPVEGEV